jgi:hypothetical protein
MICGGHMMGNWSIGTIILLAVVVLTSSFIPTALAEEGTQDAIGLFNVGSELAEKGRYQDAIRIWEDIAFDLPMKYQSVVQMNMAMAYEKLDKLPEAWHHAQLAMRMAPKGDTSARDLQDNLTKRLIGPYTKVLFFIKPEDAIIYFGDKAEGQSFQSPLYWWLKPTKNLYQVHITRSGYKAQTRRFRVKRGASPYQSVKVELEKIPEGAKITEPKERGGSRILEWSLIGGGAALAATGGILGYLASSKNDDLKKKYPDGTADHLQAWENKKNYDQAYDDEVKSKLIASYALYGIGGVAAITGAVLLIVRKPEAGKKQVKISPLIIPDGSGAAFSVSW